MLFPFFPFIFFLGVFTLVGLYKSWVPAAPRSQIPPSLTGCPFIPSILTTRFPTLRTLMPQPPGHRVHVELTKVVSPFSGTGVHAQFWDQIERSSVSFQGNGESAVPAAPPITKDKKLRLSIFIESSP